MAGCFAHGNGPLCSIKCWEILVYHRNVLASQEQPCSIHKLLIYLLTYLFIYLLTYLLNPCSRVHLEKLTGFAANQEIPRILCNPKVWCVLRLRMEERPPVRRAAANILNKQSRTADKRWSSSLGDWGEVLTTSHRENYLCYATKHKLVSYLIRQFVKFSRFDRHERKDKKLETVR